VPLNGHRDLLAELLGLTRPGTGRIHVALTGRLTDQSYMVPTSRIRPVNAAPLRTDRRMVLYWRIAARRTRANYGVDRAVEHARALGSPLVVLEALRVDHQWASRRFH